MFPVGRPVELTHIWETRVNLLTLKNSHIWTSKLIFFPPLLHDKLRAIIRPQSFTVVTQENSASTCEVRCEDRAVCTAVPQTEQREVTAMKGVWAEGQMHTSNNSSI